MISVVDKANSLMLNFYSKMSSPASCEHCFECDEKPCKIKTTVAKQCALIAVEEILAIMESDDKENLDCYWINSSKYRYWENVKKEITQL